MTVPTVDLVRHGSAAVVTLNNPDAYNALAPNMAEDLVDTMRGAAANRSCRAIVLTGEGDQALCAGIDVKPAAPSLRSGILSSPLRPSHEAFA